MRRLMTATAVAAVAITFTAMPVAACGGLIGPNGAVNLLRTTTFAGYHDGVEHYVTAFEFAGGGGEFGSITPLPGVPTKVERGGDWTLQRLQLETAGSDGAVLDFARAETAGSVEVLLETQIDALEITVLRGGGDEVGLWARDNDFRLPPDAPEVLDFYAQRSPIFLAARFDADAAAERGQQIGDGTPVHVTIPTGNPWVPLRILGLGKSDAERVEADVFLLTDREPALLPVPRDDGLFLEHSSPATDALLADLRSDAGMEWVPRDGWLTQLRVDASAAELTYDLAVDASGEATPSAKAAGLGTGDVLPPAEVIAPTVVAPALAVLVGLIAAAVLVRRRTAAP